MKQNCLLVGLQENLNLQKLVLELDHQRAYTKQQLLETHEKGNSLLKHHKDQYTMSLVRDLRIEQV
jgi:hypothetical protein